MYLSWFNADLDEGQVLGELENYLWIESGEKSFYKNVKRLRGGYSIRVDSDGKMKHTRWWDTLDHLHSVPTAFSSQVEDFKELFYDACRLRMRSDVPIGTALSGGVDSSSVFCSMQDIASKLPSARLSKDWQNAFVGVYSATCQDEELAAREVVMHSGCRGDFEPIDPMRAIEDLDDIIFQCEQVGVWIKAGPWYVYKKMRENGIYVSLDGHGGDELLGGYP